MEHTRRVLLGMLFVNAVVLVDGFLLVEHRSEPEGMVWVDAGSAPDVNGDQPTELMEVAGFWIDAEAITEQQFQQFLQASDYQYSMAADHPQAKPDSHWAVTSDEKISKAHRRFKLAYEDARAYCQWLGKKVSSPVQHELAARDAAITPDHSDFRCVKYHRSNDIATLWLH